MDEILKPDVRRRLESVAKTLETCGKHGIPIDFAMLASDIREALRTQAQSGVPNPSRPSHSSTGDRE
jgi:hypothetical protein